MAGKKNRPAGDLKQDILRLLSNPETRLQISEALVREATVGNKSGSVIRAIELVREILGEPGADQDSDFSALSDGELWAMIARLEAEEHEPEERDPA